MNQNNAISERPVGEMNFSEGRTTAKFLNGLLANEYALFTKTLNYHWNITGPHFHSLHKFLEEQYTSLLGVMDDTAERVKILGEVPISTVAMMQKHMSLEETSGHNMSSHQMIHDLFSSNLDIQDSIKTFLSKNDFKNDPVTEDFLVGLLSQHEKVSWMLKSHIA